MQAAHQARAGSDVLVTTQQVAIALGATVLGTLYARLLGPVGGGWSGGPGTGRAGLLRRRGHRGGQEPADGHAVNEDAGG